jgi:hypothetical protein
MDIHRCTHCEKELNPKTMVWLELSFKTGKWYKPGECPPEESQGSHPVGRKCSKTLLNRGA